MGFKRVSTKVLTVGTARWLIFRYGLDALAIGQCGSLHHLQRVLLWFKWGPPRRTMLLDHLPLVFPQRWDLLLTWKHWHHLQLRKQTMFAPFCTSTLLFKLRFMYITSTYNTVRRLLNPMFSYQKETQIISRCFLCGLQFICMFFCRNMVNLHTERLTTNPYQLAGPSTSLKNYHLIKRKIISKGEWRNIIPGHLQKHLVFWALQTLHGEICSIFGCCQILLTLNSLPKNSHLGTQSS